MTTSATDVLLERARAWAAEDPDESTRAELEQIISEVTDGGDPADLADRFSGTLEFGTAGLRGAVGAGPNRMNRVVVIRAAAVELSAGDLEALERVVPRDAVVGERYADMSSVNG